MRELHVVAVSEDGRHVVLSATKGAKTGTHRVRLDARLVAAVRGELPGSEPTVDLSPKEIQARLRAGETAEHIATVAGVPVTRVERFAGPVAGEMARMIDAAREAYVVRGRRGPSAVALGKAVRDAVGVPEQWSARREADGRWRVAVAWHARGRDRAAAWLYDPATKALTPTDPASAALGHVDASAPRPKKPAGTPKPGPTAAAAAPTPTVAKPAKAKPARAASKKAAPKVAAKPAPRASKVGTSAAAPTRTATPPARTRTAATQPAARAARSAAPATGATPRPARPRLRVVPDHAPRKAAPAPKAVADERDGVKARASVPAWADVLLGTTPGVER